MVCFLVLAFINLSLFTMTCVAEYVWERAGRAIQPAVINSITFLALEEEKQQAY